MMETHHDVENLHRQLDSVASKGDSGRSLCICIAAPLDGTLQDDLIISGLVDLEAGDCHGKGPQVNAVQEHCRQPGVLHRSHTSSQATAAHQTQAGRQAGTEGSEVQVCGSWQCSILPDLPRAQLAHVI